MAKRGNPTRQTYPMAPAQPRMGPKSVDPKTEGAPNMLPSTQTKPKVKKKGGY